MNPFDHLKKGDVDYFKELAYDVLLNARDDNSDTLLSTAAIFNKLEIFKVIHTRCPSLFWHQNVFLNTSMHHALWYDASIEFIQFLIDVALQSTNQGGSVTGRRWLAIQNYEGDTSLTYAVIKRRPEVTRMLVAVDHDHELSKIANFQKSTPLHLAVEYQHYEQIDILAIPDPDFDYGENKFGETPLLMAMREAASANDTAVRIKKLLLERQVNQCKARSGPKNWTTLHHVASRGYITAIGDIITVSPECMQMVDNEGRNFLHVAAKFEQVDLMMHVLDRTDVPSDVLNAVDNYGNTPLHIAAMGGNERLILCLLYDPRVIKTTVNTKGQKVLDAIIIEYDKERAGVYGVRDRVNEQELKDQSDFDLVVGALVAAVAFTAGITVPGGFISKGAKQGMSVLAKDLPFEIFIIANNFALALSLFAVFSHFCTRRLLKREDIIYQLKVAVFCTLGAIFAMMVAFMAGSYTVLAISRRLAIVVCVSFACIFIFAFRAVWRMSVQHQSRR